MARIVDGSVGKTNQEVSLWNLPQVACQRVKDVAQKITGVWLAAAVVIAAAVVVGLFVHPIAGCAVAAIGLTAILIFHLCQKKPVEPIETKTEAKPAQSPEERKRIAERHANAAGERLDRIEGPVKSVAHQVGVVAGEPERPAEEAPAPEALVVDPAEAEDEGGSWASERPRAKPPSRKEPIPVPVLVPGQKVEDPRRAKREAALQKLLTKSQTKNK
jgi:hypothetical protein